MDKNIEKTICDTVCRIHKTADFTILSNRFIRSTNISCQSITLLATAMGLPYNWNYSVKGLEKIIGVGETATRNMLDELQEWGYLTITKLIPSKETHGRIKYVYDFYEYSAKDTSVPMADVVMETYTADNANLYKTKKDSHFTVISNKLLRSNNLNPKQKGILLKVLSLPNTWKFSVSGLVKICKEGVSAVKARIAELSELGYLVRTRLNSNETFTRSRQKIISGVFLKYPTFFSHLMPHLQCFKSINCCFIFLPHSGHIRSLIIYYILSIFIKALAISSTSCSELSLPNVTLIEPSLYSLGTFIALITCETC